MLGVDRLDLIVGWERSLNVAASSTLQGRDNRFTLRRRPRHIVTANSPSPPGGEQGIDLDTFFTTP
jgi:hypothetical protein